ncbi:MAG: hypothetical protein LBJ67_04510 [Planctomycetaceae bacterium]|nr:hypothetical protein [Planctomycetaceae bacterium]
MRQRPFRFLHAADLNISQPLNGLGDVPAHLLPRVVDAPRVAAERVFAAAITAQVDFVILSGNLLNPYQTGPWGPVFLVDQFEKLNAAKIPVFWATGKSDAAERLPTELELPPNVTVFPVSHVESSVFEKDGFSIAKILGVSRSSEHRKIRPGEFTPDNSGLFTIAVAVGKVNPSRLKNRGIDYWALGGNPVRHTSYGQFILAQMDEKKHEQSKSPTKFSSQESLKKTQNKDASDKKDSEIFSPIDLKRVREELSRSSIVHYPGVTLARNFDDNGHYGATLAEVDEFGQIQMSLVPTSPVRFVNEQVRVESTANLERLKEELRDRLISHRSLQDRYDLFVRWTVDGSQELETKLRRDAIVTPISDELRREFGTTEPFSWVVEIAPTLSENLPPEYYDQETILGDYLRKLRRYQMGEAHTPSLERYLPKDSPIFPQPESESLEIKSDKKSEKTFDLDEYAEPLLRSDTKKQEDILREASLLGVELLGFHESDELAQVTETKDFKESKRKVSHNPNVNVKYKK